MSKNSLSEINNHSLSKAKELLKKSVGAIHCSGNLTLVERRIANVLLFVAYDDLLEQRTHSIHVSIISKLIGWTDSNRMDYLKKSLMNLQKTTIEFNLRNDGKEKWESMSMLSYVHIEDGICSWRYDESMAVKLYDPDIFAIIDLQVQNRINSVYALNIYENCVRYINTNSTGVFSIELLRAIVGATSKYYDDFRKFNEKVIKKAITMINECTDITLKAEYIKTGHEVTAIKFHVVGKTGKELQTIENVYNRSLKSLAGNKDEFSEAIKSPAFQALLKHGIPARLAATWMEDFSEQEILNMVAYAEERDSKNLINTNTSSYIKGLVAVGANFNISQYEKDKAEEQKEAQKNEDSKIKEKRKKQRLELEEQFKIERRNLILNNLSLQDRQQYAQAWLATEKGKGKESDFDGKNGDFRNQYNNVNFRCYLMDVAVNKHTPEEFEEWLNKRKSK